jgi:outer membrane protein assembly factor BamB
MRFSPRPASARRFGRSFLIAFLLALPHPALARTQKIAPPAPPPPETGWRISPEKINLEMGDTRTLQTLDDSAQELEGAAWSVDDDALAELREDANGRTIVRPKAPGTVRVTATIAGERRVRDITIWPDRKMPTGTTRWAVHPIGREVGDIPAVPVADAPNMYSLEQTASGATYLRAGRDDGIQIWNWRMPGEARDVELVCGDWIGGAVISANRRDGYTLYAVDKDGTERWHYDASGVRKGLAISTEHLLHLLSRSADGTVVTVAGIDEGSGVKRFEHTLPVSIDRYLNVRPQGGSFVCSAKEDASNASIAISRLFVNTDGNAYLAFTERSTTFRAPPCSPGSTVDLAEISKARNEKLVLWRLHPDGAYRSRVVEAFEGEQSAASPIASVSPTGALIPDGLDGVLLSVRRSRRANAAAATTIDESVYRIDAESKIVYSFPLPKYTGTVHDGMVLGEQQQAFATRGGTLSVFDVRTGQPLWTWDSQSSEIEVLAALAQGGVAVQTPAALVEVRGSGASREIVKGKALLDWLGNLYIKR